MSVPDPAWEDERLMLAFRDGSDRALEILFDRHAERLNAVLHRMTRDPALATDLTQTTFLSVIRSRDRFDADSRFAPWLYTIAMNALRDQRRRAKRERLGLLGMMPDVDYQPPLSDPGLMREVQSALAALPEDQREAVLLRQVEGFSFKEIASMAGTTEGAIKVRAHRGYERLRALLGRLWKEEP